MPYIMTSWVNDSPPPINASNLNKMEEGIYNAHVAVASNVTAIASSVAYASTLYANISANASAIQANSDAIGSVSVSVSSVLSYASVIGAVNDSQAAAIASNTAGVATLLDVSATHTTQIAEILATQGSLGTWVYEIEATSGFLASQVDEIIATQTSIISDFSNLTASYSSLEATQAHHSSQISALILGGDANVTAALVANEQQLGAGPLSEWNNLQPINVTATDSYAVAKYIRYIPMATVGLPTGVSQFTINLMSNAGVASPTKDISFALLNNVGTVITALAATSIPSVATSSVVEEVTFTTANPSVTLNPNTTYYLVVATDDLYRSAFIGVGANSAAEAIVRHNRNVAHEYHLPSGPDLTLYGSLPVLAASSITSDEYPAIYVS